MAKLDNQRANLFKRHIGDVVMDISQSNHWRQLLFSSEYNKKHLINSDSEFHFPNHTKTPLLEHNLKFYVSKVLECPEEFDEWCVIFKFESIEFPEITQYSGNYFGEFQNIL